MAQAFQYFIHKIFKKLQVTNLRDKKILTTGGTSGIEKALMADFIGLGATHIAVLARIAQGLRELDEEFENIHFLSLQGNIADLKTIHGSVEKIGLRK